MSLDVSRHSSRRARPLVRFESVERRMLLAAVSHAIGGFDDALVRVSDRGQYSKYELDVTREWAVRADAATRPAELAEKLGASSVRPSGILDDVFIATFARTKLQRLGGAAMAERVERVAGVGESWPLVARQQSTRAVPNDPRFANQWHLLNTGQGGGTVGADANIVDVWDQYKGSGVVIGVVDDGVTPNHQDLAPNYLPALSYDFNRNDPVPDGGDHGTSVAGVAAARGNNGVGGSGAAPLAGIAGLQLIDGSSTDDMEANALSYLNQDIDIYSNSWGPYDWGTIIEGPGLFTLAAMESSILNGRGGLGSIYTWAGGNGGVDDNANFDGYANSRYTIAVAAITNTGAQSYYSERGANLLVAAYSSGGTRGIDTTAGSSNTAYTTSFGGTSSATPLVSGVIALMLEANPNLTWRDVQHILAKTAEKVSPSDGGWSLNGAGLNINDKFGFGAVDALAAVNLARTWSTVAPEVSATSGTLAVNAAIPNNSAAGISRTATIIDPIRVESVEVVFNATHTSRGELQVILVSPSGTESVLAPERADTGDHFINWTFSSMRHLDEDARGIWTLKVIDDSGTTAGTWGDWKLNVHGTQLATTPTVSGFVYADLDGNGSRGESETGLAGMSVWADLDLDGDLDAGEPTAVTGATGAFAIADLSLGDVTIRAAAPAGRFVTQGAAGRSFTLTASAPYVAGAQFGIVSPAATGTIFNDADADGIRDPDEAGVAGATVFADLNLDGLLTAGEPNATSDVDGFYRVEGLAAGGPVSIRVLAPAGRRLTGPRADGFSVTPVVGAYVSGQNDVGATAAVRLSGRSFDDQNRDGLYTPGEPGVAGARVFLDANGNGVRDDSPYDHAQNTAVSLPDNSTRTSTLSIANTGATVNDLSVRVAMTHTWMADVTITLVSPLGTRVILAQRHGGQRNGVNVTFNASAATTPTAWPTSDGTAVTGVYRPVGDLASLNGQALDGVWTLEVTDSASGDTGTLTSWSLFGTFTEVSTLTAADGVYAFDALPAGTYRIRQEAPPAPYEPSAALADPIVVNAHAGTVHTDNNLANLGPSVAAPAFTEGDFLVNAHALLLSFSGEAIVEAADLTLSDIVTGDVIPAAALAITQPPDWSYAIVTVPGLPGGVLPDGDYRLTIGTDVQSPGGVPLAAAADLDFFVLAGDANRDRTVDFDDLLILAQNYGQSGLLFTQGNFDYSADGLVDFDDLLLLAQNYGTSLSGLFAAAPITTKPVATAKKREPTIGDVIR